MSPYKSITRLQAVPSNNAPHRRRGIYLLPNLFTTMSLFCGFYAITAAVRHDYMAAVLVILVATAMDMFDGRVARLTGTQSEFGHHYDSLTDLISFGVAPAVLFYQWTLSSLGKLGWAISFLYAATAAMRLARYNVQTGAGAGGAVERRFFQGLASTAAGGLMAAYTWLVIEYGGGESLGAHVGAAVLMLSTAGLMISNLRYHSLKDVDFRGRIRFLTIPMLLGGLVLISIEPPLLLFMLFFGYLTLGPLYTLTQVRRSMRLRHLRRRRRQESPRRGATG